jgi:hypothetical protein
MARWLLALSIVACISPAFAGVSIVDGDTLKIDGVTIRIVEIDTPETFRSRCENELVLGLKAKERIRQLVDSGPVTYVKTGTDRYGRTLAKVFAGEVNVGEMLLEEGIALRYQPGADAKLARLKVWCGQDATLDDTWSAKPTQTEPGCIPPLLQQDFDLNPNRCRSGSIASLFIPADATAEADESEGSVYYPNCTAARAAGAAPIQIGEAGYRRKLDRDGDGVACE